MSHLLSCHTLKAQRTPPPAPCFRIPRGQPSSAFQSCSRQARACAAAEDRPYVEEEDGIPVVTTEPIEAEAEAVDPRLPITVRNCGCYPPVTLSNCARISATCRLTNMVRVCLGYHWILGIWCVTAGVHLRVALNCSARRLHLALGHLLHDL